MQIDVTLEVYKALTARLRYEGQTYDEVIRELLSLDSPIEPDDPPRGLGAALNPSLERHLANVGSGSGFYSRGLLLPNGTKLRARYKGREYQAVVQDDDWVDQGGNVHSSPSAAASAITDNNVNGWRFWEAKRPRDLDWRRLDSIAAESD